MRGICEQHANSGHVGQCLGYMVEYAAWRRPLRRALAVRAGNLTAHNNSTDLMEGVAAKRHWQRGNAQQTKLGVHSGSVQCGMAHGVFTGARAGSVLKCCTVHCRSSTPRNDDEPQYVY